MQTQSRSSCCFIRAMINIFFGEETLHGKSLCVVSLRELYSVFYHYFTQGLPSDNKCSRSFPTSLSSFLAFEKKKKSHGGLQTSSCDLQLVYIIWQQTAISQVSVCSLDRCTAGIRPAFIQTCPINHHKTLVEFSRLLSSIMLSLLDSCSDFR